MNKKIVILLGDGMADWPIESLDNKTPLEAANIPNMDRLAREGITGLTQTVPKGMNPGSDTANLSVFSYDPKKYYTGRAPLEAINMGIELGPNDAAFRCNIVNIKNGIMNDFTADHIETALSKIVIEEVSKFIEHDDITLYPGVSYRNILVWKNYPYDKICDATPPHDISDKEFKNHLPSGSGADVLIEIMEKSQEIISNSKKIQSNIKELHGDPNSFWLWGGGKRPAIDTLEEKYGLKGYTISAVDLIHGIGRAAGLEPIEVEGATGYLDTNYKGKVDALFEGLEKSNFVFLHVEAPDESGHEGNIEHKLKAIEDFDSQVVGPVLKGMEKYDDYSVLVMPDHPTPIEIKTHSSEAVPFIIYNKKGISSEKFSGKNSDTYSEKSASQTKLMISEAHNLIKLLIEIN